MAVVARELYVTTHLKGVLCVTTAPVAPALLITASRASEQDSAPIGLSVEDEVRSDPDAACYGFQHAACDGFQGTLPKVGVFHRHACALLRQSLYSLTWALVPVFFGPVGARGVFSLINETFSLDFV